MSIIEVTDPRQWLHRVEAVKRASRSQPRRLSHDLPASTVEAISNRCLLCVEAQVTLALLVGAHAVVADVFPMVS